MLLTKKSIIKILIMGIAYFVLGSIGIASMLLFGDLQMLYLGIACYLLGVIFVLLVIYAEGKGNLLNLANKLVRKELKPAEFIKAYEKLKSSENLIVRKPGVEVLQMLIAAYDALDDRENALAAADEMIFVASDKKKLFAKLIKASLLFSYGMTEEAETLFCEVQTSKHDLMCQSLIDVILKSDRAMAMEDYKTVELHSLQMLDQSFPKLDNFGKLVISFRLGEVYEKMQNTEKAISYYLYCAENGGETAIKEAAKSALDRLQ